MIGELFLIERELPDWQIIEDPVLREAQLQHIREVRQRDSAPSAAMAGVDPKAYLRAAAGAALTDQRPILPRAFKTSIADHGP